MIGKQICELLDMTEADLSDNITLLRNCGLAPNVVSLLEKRNLWTNRLHSLPLDNMSQMDEKKVSLYTFLYSASKHRIQILQLFMQQSCMAKVKMLFEC